jgi:glycosyltransferase involved in cell wall biosynthesis
VIYNSVSINKPAKSESPYYNNNSAIKILVLGQIYPGKGQKDAAIAVSELLDKGYNVELIIAGRSASLEYCNDIEKLISEKNHDNNIRLIDFVENPFQLISECDILLVCSRSEAFGRVTIEGMLLGKPVIGLNNGGTSELIRNNYNGFLYEPNNMDQLKNHIMYYYNNRSIIMIHGEQAKEYVGSIISEEHYIGGIYEILMGINQAIDRCEYKYYWHNNIYLKYLLKDKQTMSQNLLRLQSVFNKAVAKLIDFYKCSINKNKK